MPNADLQLWTEREGHWSSESGRRKEALIEQKKRERAQTLRNEGTALHDWEKLQRRLAMLHTPPPTYTK